MLYIGFFGGEPLSNFDHMSFHLRISAFNSALHIHAEAVQNGYGTTKEELNKCPFILHQLYPCQTSILIREY